MLQCVVAKPRPPPHRDSSLLPRADMADIVARGGTMPTSGAPPPRVSSKRVSNPRLASARRACYHELLAGLFPPAKRQLMDQQFFAQLRQTLDKEGAPAAIERLCAGLREHKDYTGLFYALLMKKRYELGVSPIPTGSSQDLPPETHAAYEDAIRDAG